jgi:hypothetical protein
VKTRSTCNKPANTQANFRPTRAANTKPTETMSETLKKLRAELARLNKFETDLGSLQAERNAIIAVGSLEKDACERFASINAGLVLAKESREHVADAALAVVRGALAEEGRLVVAVRAAHEAIDQAIVAKTLKSAPEDIRDSVNPYKAKSMVAERNARIDPSATIFDPHETRDALLVAITKLATLGDNIELIEAELARCSKVAKQLGINP